MQISKDTFIIIAMKSYDNIHCKTLEEFGEDIGNFSLLSRLCRKEVDDEVAKQILNLMMSLLNVFESDVCISLMFFKVPNEYWPKLKTVLVYLNRMPDEISNLNIKNSNIPLCNQTINILRTV